MSFKFEMADFNESLTGLYHYVAEIADEAAWKNEPVITDTPMGTSIKFPHPDATPKEVKATTEPFSYMSITFAKPYVPQFSIEFGYDSKKAAARFEDMLQPRNKNISDEFFAILAGLDGFTFKLQMKTAYKKIALAKYDDVFVVPSGSATAEEVIEHFKKVNEMCDNAEVEEEGKVVKNRLPRVTLCRDYEMDDLVPENAPFENVVKVLHAFMVTETKVISAKDVEKARRGRSKIEGKNKFKTILSNRADKEFYCRLSKTELERLPETVGVLLWDLESFEEKKYIRGALKLVREI